MASLNEELDRKMPFSLEAEQSVLGSILIHPEAFSEIAGMITSDDFYLEDHREIYQAMQEMFLTNRTIDTVTLIDTLVKRGVYPTTEQSKNYIKLIVEIVPSASNIADYASIVHDKAQLRRLIDACADISNNAYHSQGDVSSILEASEAKIFSIVQGNETKNFSHIRDLIISVYDHLQQLASDTAEAGVPTGFGDLDNVLVGLNAGDLVLVGARPGMGKTSFSLNIATHVAKKTQKAVAVFSLEMSGEQLVTRMLSSEALIDSYTLRSGHLTDEDWTKLAEAASSLSECDILIDDTTGITAVGMKAKLRRVKNLGMVVIDYLQLMQSDRHIDNRVQEVSDISRNLKLLAKELKVPVIACAQLSRATESRTGEKIPMLSDLRDSGSIEQDADIVMFLYRPEYYNQQQEAGAEEPKLNTAQVIIAKNRHGSTGKVEMGWIGKYTRFMPISDLTES